jgi:hypothetical protein
MNITTVTPTITITPFPNDTMCIDTTVTFTAGITSGGTTPIYQWVKNGVNVGTDTNTYSFAPLNGDSVRCILTSNFPCAISPVSSNMVTMVINLVLHPAITASGGTLSTTPYTTYQWYLNGSPISGATNQSYTPTTNGDYTVMVTDINGCSGTSAISTVNGLGVNTLINNGGVEVYPNPANSLLNIKTVTNVTYKLTDIIGTEKQKGILPKGEHSITITALPQGMYLLELIDEQGMREVRKVVKE